jgi:hypothetical protein
MEKKPKRKDYKREKVKKRRSDCAKK